MLLNAAEVAKHNTTSSCWIVIGGKVYDVTPYLERHPGGAAILVKQGGRVRIPSYCTYCNHLYKANLFFSFTKRDVVLRQRN